MAVNYAEPECFMCSDCGHDTRAMGERYMLADRVWHDIAMADRSVVAYMLCVGCAERRAGRRLVAVDFNDCPLNAGAVRQSLRLRQRLRATA